MTPIQNPMIPLDGLFLGQGAALKNQKSGASAFDALLASLDIGSNRKNTSGSVIDILTADNNSPVNSSDPLSGLISGTSDMTTGSLNDMFSAIMGQGAAKFPFSDLFESTFGTGGPLPNFITLMSAKLHLTKEQNQAFQDIAIKNKDATQSEENVQKIALELKEAGIG
jgi:hypothetical protein